MLRILCVLAWKCKNGDFEEVISLRDINQIEQMDTFWGDLAEIYLLVQIWDQMVENVARTEVRKIAIFDKSEK